MNFFKSYYRTFKSNISTPKKRRKFKSNPSKIHVKTISQTSKIHYSKKKRTLPPRRYDTSPRQSEFESAFISRRKKKMQPFVFRSIGGSTSAPRRPPFATAKRAPVWIRIRALSATLPTSRGKPQSPKIKQWRPSGCLCIRVDKSGRNCRFFERDPIYVFDFFCSL